MRIYTIDRCAHCGCKHNDVEGEWRCFHPKIGGKKKVDPATLPDWCPHPVFKHGLLDVVVGNGPSVLSKSSKNQKGLLLDIGDIFTERYIKMCKEAHSFIGGPSFAVGDFVLVWDGKKYVVDVVCRIERGRLVTNYSVMDRISAIRIYRLDQLIRMFGIDFSVIGLKNGMWDVVVGDYATVSDSIEEAYFEGCIYKKMGMKWCDEGEEWVKL